MNLTFICKRMPQMEPEKSSLVESPLPLSAKESFVDEACSRNLICKEQACRGKKKSLTYRQPQLLLVDWTVSNGHKLSSYIGIIFIVVCMYLNVLQQNFLLTSHLDLTAVFVQSCGFFEVHFSIIFTFDTQKQHKPRLNRPWHLNILWYIKPSIRVSNGRGDKYKAQIS